MKYNGVVREIDSLGRIVIPKEYRNILGMNIHDPVETIIRGRELIVRRYEAGCVICGETGTMYNVGGREICGNCISVIRSCELIRHG